MSTSRSSKKHRIRGWRSLAVAALALGLFSAATVHGGAVERVSPDVIPGSIKIDAEGLINLAANTSGLIIIDSRIASDRLQGHIEGSVSLPDEETTCEALGAHITAKDAPVVFYCNGPKCGRSAVAVEVALTCGYRNIYWFRGGFEEWKQKKYPYVKE